MPVLPQSKLPCNSVRQVVFHSIEANQWARHRVHVLVCEALVAKCELLGLNLLIRLPNNLQWICFHKATFDYTICENLQVTTNN